MLGGERDSAKSKLRILKLEFALKRRTAKDGMVIPTRLWYPQIWTPIENIKELGESGNGIVQFSNPAEIWIGDRRCWDSERPKPVQDQSKMVGREAPHHFGWVLKRIGAVETSKFGDLRSRNRPHL